MASKAEIQVNPENLWRTETPGAPGWGRDTRAGAANKYFMISVDTHLSPPPKLFMERIAPEYRDRLPRIEVRDGRRYLVQEGCRPEAISEPQMSGEDLVRTKAGGAPNVGSGAGPTEKTGLARIQDQELDGVDGEVIFPNGPALLMWGSTDPAFVMAQCRIWNDWAMEVCGPVHDRCKPAAAIAPADLEASIEEVKRVAKLGYKALILPLKPIWGAHDVSHVNYNLPHFDPLWQVIQDHDLVMCFHVATGKDPRCARGNGGAVINYVVHSNAPTLEPLVNLCASGVFDRFPRLKAGTIEANAGWVGWFLDQMDESYKKHHFWVRPKLKRLPSDYYRSNCFSSIAEDRVALILCDEYRLGENLMWANDYPHHEGTWPHSAEAIERTFRDYVSETTRAKILGLNAARMFGFDIPQKYR
jgi:predicted TIM-barrel fold metal-dependent hydrolase